MFCVFWLWTDKLVRKTWPEDNCWGKPSRELLQNGLEVIKCKQHRVSWQATRFCSRVSHSNANSTWAGSRKNRDKKILLPDAWWDLQMRSHLWTSCRYRWPRCVPAGSPQAPAKVLQVLGQRGRAGLVPGVSSLALSQPLWVQVFYLEVIFRWKQEAACKCETSLTNPFGLEEVLK